MSSGWMDRLGGVASAACALHCLVLSAAPSIIALLGLEVLAGEAFEWGFFAMAVIFAIIAAVLGYRVHRTGWVLVGFGVGVLVLIAGRLSEAFALHEGGVFLAVLGGTLLVASHVASLRQLRAFKANIVHEECCP